MIITQSQKAVSTLPQNGGTFDVEVSAKLFEIISTKIYQYPVAACIRELATNAHDSHIEAGNLNPFIVSLPSKLNPFFIVEDFGVGLDDSDMTNIYRTVFKSTKENSNTQTGAFGVGRFAALAVSETFNIVARKNGVERHYVVSFIAGDVPRLDMLAEFPTAERNGVKVSVPVKESDFHRFINHAEEYLSYFPIRPIVNGNGFQFTATEEQLNELNDSGILRRTSSRYSKTVSVVMGGVPYSVDYHRIFEDIQEPDFLRNIRGDFFVRVEIGDVSVSTSRESLEMNEHTLSAFPKIAQKIIDHAKNAYDEMLAIPHINDRIRESERLYDNNLTGKNYRSPKMLKRSDRIQFSNVSYGIRMKNIRVLFNDTKRKVNINYVPKSGVQLFIDAPLSDLRKERFNKIFGFEVTYTPYSEVFEKFKPRRSSSSVVKLDDDKKNLKVQVRLVNGDHKVIDFNEEEGVCFVDARDVSNVTIDGKGFSLKEVSDMAKLLNTTVVIRRKSDHKLFEKLGIIAFLNVITNHFEKVTDHGRGVLCGWERVFVEAGLLDDVPNFKSSNEMALTLVPKYAKSVEDNSNKVYTTKQVASRLTDQYPLVPTGWNYTDRLFTEYVEYVKMKSEIKKEG